MKLSKQKQQLIDLYSDGNWHCSVEIAPLFIRDYRKRLSELNREGYTFISSKCSGECGIKHNSNIHMYRLGKQPIKPVFYVRHPLTGKRITTKELATL